MGLICIYMNSRSGSSLVTKIFHAHGCWVGSTAVDPNTAKSNKPAYPVYEWTELKWAMKPKGAGWKLDGTFVKPDPVRALEVEGVIRKRTEAYFIWKGLPDYHPYLMPYNPKIITIKRKIENVIASEEADPYWASVTRRRVELMEELNGVEVDTDQVISGDFTSLEAAFDHCGIAFDPLLSERQIDRSLWHHG